MATLDAPAPTNGTSKPSSPVPLDTIPVSPNQDTNGITNKMNNENKAPSGTSPKESDEEEQITVFHDPNNFNVKHPLMHNWTLWFTKPPSGKVLL